VKTQGITYINISTCFYTSRLPWRRYYCDVRILLCNSSQWLPRSVAECWSRWVRRCIHKRSMCTVAGKTNTHHLVVIMLPMFTGRYNLDVRKTVWRNDVLPTKTQSLGRFNWRIQLLS